MKHPFPTGAQPQLDELVADLQRQRELAAQAERALALYVRGMALGLGLDPQTIQLATDGLIVPDEIVSDLADAHDVDEA